MRRGENKCTVQLDSGKGNDTVTILTSFVAAKLILANQFLPPSFSCSLHVFHRNFMGVLFQRVFIDFPSIFRLIFIGFPPVFILSNWPDLPDPPAGPDRPLRKAVIGAIKGATRACNGGSNGGDESEIRRKIT